MAQELDKTIFEITGHRISSNSIVNAFDVYKTKDGIYFLNIFKSLNFGEMDDRLFHFYEFGYDERWDNIANEYYGTPYLWWIIPLMNNIVNPFEQPEEGRNIRILKQDYLYNILNEWRSLSGL